MKSKFFLMSKVLGYKLFRRFGRPRIMPINYTISVTNKCNSRCRTCFIWSLYDKKPNLKYKELTTEEFIKLSESLGKSPFWITLSGGEPFLRKDISEICISLDDVCSPSIINIPTNGLLKNTIIKRVDKILSEIDSTLIINLSLDAIGKKHDEIRGVKGSFDRLIQVYEELKKLKNKFDNFQLGIHSVVSVFSIDHLLNTYEFVKNLKPDSYITEVAEERSELFNKNKKITPTPKKYKSVIRELTNRIEKDYLHSDKEISKLTQAFRIFYYSLATEILKNKEQIVPCFAGIASCHINAFGDVWPCCILGYDKPFGNLRETDFDFRSIWFSEKANKIRESIKNKECYCPLANASYTNMLCNFSVLTKVLLNLLK